jgi:tRNA (guanine-N7-)-methyltransferase
MRRRCRQHVNPLKMSSLVPRPAPLPLPQDGLVEVELGCGNGLFLLSRAEMLPQRIFLGLDIRQAFLQEGQDEQLRRGLPNISFHVTNLIVDADRLFPPGRVHRYYINFPDPWFKLRQQNRRWLNKETLSQLITTLAPEGEIFFQSDVWSLALEALSLFEMNPRLQNTVEEWRFLRHNPFRVRSAREIACQELERPIWRMLFRLSAVA